MFNDDSEFEKFEGENSLFLAIKTAIKLPGPYTNLQLKKLVGNVIAKNRQDFTGMSEDVSAIFALSKVFALCVTVEHVTNDKVTYGEKNDTRICLQLSHQNSTITYSYIEEMSDVSAQSELPTKGEELLQKNEKVVTIPHIFYERLLTIVAMTSANNCTAMTFDEYEKKCIFATNLPVDKDYAVKIEGLFDVCLRVATAAKNFKNVFDKYIVFGAWAAMKLEAAISENLDFNYKLIANPTDQKYAEEKQKLRSGEGFFYWKQRNFFYAEFGEDIDVQIKNKQAFLSLVKIESEEHEWLVSYEDFEIMIEKYQYFVGYSFAKCPMPFENEKDAGKKTSDYHEDEKHLMSILEKRLGEIHRLENGCDISITKFDNELKESFDDATYKIFPNQKTHRFVNGPYKKNENDMPGTFEQKIYKLFFAVIELYLDPKQGGRFFSNDVLVKEIFSSSSITLKILDINSEDSTDKSKTPKVSSVCTPHAEMKLIQEVYESIKAGKIFTVGIALPCCPLCWFAIKAINLVYGQNGEDVIKLLGSTHNRINPTKVPLFLFEDLLVQKVFLACFVAVYNYVEYDGQLRNKVWFKDMIKEDPSQAINLLFSIRNVSIEKEVVHYRSTSPIVENIYKVDLSLEEKIEKYTEEVRLEVKGKFAPLSSKTSPEHKFGMGAGA